ncbi:MAG: molybdopterin cofactor-binding domain-containing protein [Rhodoferax sp.]|nr:molybdopterin cofactor-binding domain-containing protein [Rhodoferax sp.]
MKRRNFLRWAGAGLTVTLLPACSLIPVIPKRPAPSGEDAMSWVRYADGRYTFYLPRVEMGQNVLTGLKQVACEELGVSWDKVDALLPDTRAIRRVKATVGSDSIREFALPLAQACATLRDALKKGTTEGLLEAEPRPLESLRAFGPNTRLVGHKVPLEQGLAIVRGEPLYAADIRLPGMVYGRVLRAPASPEFASHPRQWQEAAARTTPGFVAVVQSPGLLQGHSQGLGILARTPGALDRIEAALAVTWQVDGALPDKGIETLIDVSTRLQQGPLAHRVRDAAADTQEPWTLDVEIHIPLAAHGALEPRAAVAQWVASAPLLKLWVGNQDVFYLRDAIARQLGLDTSQVLVQPCRIGGAFGGRTICTVEMEAAVLAHHWNGTVKVQWTRAQELRYGFHRPPSHHRLRARLRQGKVQHWWHAFATSHILFTNAAMPAWMQTVSHFTGDAGSARGAQIPYNVPQQRIELDLVRLPIFTGPWRGLGAGPNSFAVETAWDMLALQAKADPVAFRLAHIDDARLTQVLQQAARLAQWGQQPTRATEAGWHRGQGVACGIYKGMSYVATVAEVAVDPSSGEIKVLHMWCVHDCGRIINPDQVRAQCEGTMVWGLAMVLSDGLPLNDAGVAATSFADAPIPRWHQVPHLSVELVDSALPSTGAGETGMVSAAAAITNAIAAATRYRVTNLPVQPADLLQHMLSQPRPS